MKHLFPLRINNSLINPKRIQKTTKFGYVVNDRELIDLTCNLSTTIIGFDRHDLIDHVSNKLKESLLCPCEIEMDTDEISQLSSNIFEQTNSYSIFSLSGSDCIETAIKCVQTYHGNDRKKIIAFEHSYHGSNLLNFKLSNTDVVTGSRDKKSDDGFIHLPNTNQYNTVKEFEEETLKKLKLLFETESIACVVQETSCWNVEFITPSVDYWLKLKSLCEQYDVLLVIDDIAMSGGKTGNIFGFKVQPDIFCVGKAFGGGYFPLSVCGINQKVYDNIKNKYFHHSYTHSFHLPGIISANYYHKILREEKILNNVTSIIEKAKSVCDGLPIEIYRNYGTMFHIKFNKPLDMKILDIVFQENGLNTGFIMGEPFTEKMIWCVPIVATDEYFNLIENRLKKSLQLLY